MYTDTILFIVGAICGVITISFSIYLIVSHKKSKVYRAVLQQETEMFDALTTTALLTKNVMMSEPLPIKSELPIGKQAASNKATCLLINDDSADLLNEHEDRAKTVDFDATALEERFVLEEEIHGGGMSRVFLARSTKLGNQWIVKFISNQTGELANEENILKLLNHISLPKIIDIFHDEKGIYLVESFIEGLTLDKVLETGPKLNQVIILDWAEQLAKVLSYLHQMEPHPIYHFDLKPSNIMVTHDNKLVLIDFGISKRQGEDNAELAGVTYNYAAPEQLKHRIAEKHKPLLQSRFGELPADRLYWLPDARTDIYSLGVILFEMAVGQIPTIQNSNVLRDSVSNELYAIVMKCLAVNPEERYQSVMELLDDLQKTKGTKVKMARTLFMRKFAAVTASFSIFISGGSFVSGNYIYQQENMSLVNVEPDIVTISQQQSSELKIKKQMPDGKIVILDPSKIRWSFSRDNIAKVDGNRIAGMNAGITELVGQYRNKVVTLNVNVVEPMNGMVDISQHYQNGHILKPYAGTGKREHNDGALGMADFVSPESIDTADDGTVYVADSGLLRKITNSQVESINFEPDYLTPRIVRCYKNELYVLTHEWEDAGETYYGIIHLTDKGAEGLYISDARYTAVEDFDFSPDGLLCFIDRNEGVGKVYLKTLNTKNTDDIQTLCELPRGTSALTIDENSIIYLSNSATGVIQSYKNGTLNYFAGIENEKAFIDGTAPLFYEPQRIKYANSMLYVWDFNVIRRLSIKDGVAADAITIAGEASPTFNMELPQGRQNAEQIVLPNSKLMDLAVYENSILLTDPKRGVIWQVE